MIELKKNALCFSFPEVHPQAKLRIEFQRTLRIPDDGSDYPLPPGLGPFPLRHVDDFAEGVPPAWLTRGGVLLPMYQSEAMWLNFTPEYLADRETGYPFAVKIAAGKVCAVTGEEWQSDLTEDPQDYLVLPNQPWLDGFCVEKGIIRQFVAMPLGSGYSAEEQITGQGEHGGLQLLVHPMKREVFERRFPKVPPRRYLDEGDLLFEESVGAVPCAAPDMGLAPGGRMRQEIYDDPFDFGDWETGSRSRCFVHLANSLVWRAITGDAPPTVPPTAKEYSNAGLPWFEYYDDTPAREGSETLAKLKSVIELAREKGDNAVPENESVSPGWVTKLRRKLGRREVREGHF